MVDTTLPITCEMFLITKSILLDVPAPILMSGHFFYSAVLNLVQLLFFPFYHSSLFSYIHHFYHWFGSIPVFDHFMLAVSFSCIRRSVCISLCVCVCVSERGEMPGSGLCCCYLEHKTSRQPDFNFVYSHLVRKHRLVTRPIFNDRH